MLEVCPGWQDKLFPEDVSVFVTKYPNEAIQSIFTLSNAKLDGAAATLYEDGHLQTLAFYRKAKRHGPLKLWKENAERLLYAEYKSGNKHGLLCLFQKGMPWLIQEWDKGKATSEYLVKSMGDIPRILPTTELIEDKSAEVSTAREQLIAVEETMNGNETQLKKQMAEAWREKDQKTRKNQFLNQASDRNNRIRERSDEHQMEKDAADEAIWRRAINSATPRRGLSYGF